MEFLEEKIKTLKCMVVDLSQDMSQVYKDEHSLQLC